ncbi:hypothetical protein CGRA01v4_06419 [Colletotrichum graminicola]|nr:hypothetical protein CGRA01v4_06419 [Colletotrichum graminicola]
MGPFLSSSTRPVQHAHSLCGSVGRALVSYYINMTVPLGRDIQRSQVRALPGTVNYFYIFVCLLYQLYIHVDHGIIIICPTRPHECKTSIHPSDLMTGGQFLGYDRDSFLI